MFPISTQDKLDVLFFDNKINEKLGRGSRKMKVETKYLYEDNERLSGQIDIDSFKKEPSKNLTEFLSNKKNSEKAINYFQIINYVNNEILSEKKNNNNKDNENNISNPLKTVKSMKEAEFTDMKKKKK